MDYLMEIKKLPQKIQDILISPYGAQINDKIIKKYGLNSENRSLLIELVNDIYLKSSLITELNEEIRDGFKFDAQKSKQLALDIAGMKLLIADDEYFNGSVKKYIVSQEGNPKNFEDTVAKEKEALKKEIENYEKDKVDDIVPEREISFKKNESANPPAEEDEKNASLELFNNNIVDILSNKNPQIAELIEDYNEDLILWLGDDLKFKNNLEHVLVKNTKKLTNKDFNLNGKAQAPNISNWLQDFINKYGSKMYNNVVLTEYITNSENAKKLSDDEKKLVAKLLILYRNLRFFPESLTGLPEDKWEIIPVDREKVSTTKARQVSGPPRTAEEREIDELKQSEEKYRPGGLERLALEEEIKEKLQTEKLRAMASRYKAGSLERKAIEQEIRRLVK